jgi:hypothetical protein
LAESQINRHTFVQLAALLAQNSEKHSEWSVAALLAWALALLA